MLESSQNKNEILAYHWENVGKPVEFCSSSMAVDSVDNKMWRAYLGLVTFASEYTPGSQHVQMRKQETFTNIDSLPPNWGCSITVSMQVFDQYQWALVPHIFIFVLNP